MISVDPPGRYTSDVTLPGYQWQKYLKCEMVMDHEEYRWQQ